MTTTATDYCVAGMFTATSLSEARETARTRVAAGKGAQDIRTYSIKTGNLGKIVEVLHENGTVQKDGYFGALPVG